MPLTLEMRFSLVQKILLSINLKKFFELTFVFHFVYFG